MQCDRTTLRRTTGNATFSIASRKVSRFRVLPLGNSSMRTRHRSPTLPREVIPLMTYAQLDLYLAKFSVEELGLVLLLGRHGTGKSESVRHALSAPGSGDQIVDTEQENRASFEREGGASWGSGDRLEGAARTGGAARHASQSAE